MKRKNQPLLPGWALNEQGKEETDPNVAAKNILLMPLGGDEAHSGYKGFGLGMMVDILSAVLSGAAHGPKAGKWLAPRSGAVNTGHCFIAINVAVFAVGFDGRMKESLDYFRNMEPEDPSKPVMVAGDYERAHIELVKKNGGFSYVKNQHEANKVLAKKLGVKPLESP